jgi:hypothetical protein
MKNFETRDRRPENTEKGSMGAKVQGSKGARAQGREKSMGAKVYFHYPSDNRGYIELSSY